MCPTDEWMAEVNEWAAARRQLRSRAQELTKAGFDKPSNPAHYFLNILLAVDQLGNAILAGDPDETISSRIGKAKLRDDLSLVGKVVDMVLEALDENHSIDAIEPDEGLPDPRDPMALAKAGRDPSEALFRDGKELHGED
jgi:hypothetical protein